MNNNILSIVLSVLLICFLSWRLSLYVAINNINNKPGYNDVDKWRLLNIFKKSESSSNPDAYIKIHIYILSIIIVMLSIIILDKCLLLKQTHKLKLNKIKS